MSLKLLWQCVITASDVVYRYIQKAAWTKIGTQEISTITRNFFSVMLPTRTTTYPRRWFTRSICTIYFPALPLRIKLKIHGGIHSVTITRCAPVVSIYNSGHSYPPLLMVNPGMRPAKHYACALKFQTAAHWMEPIIGLASPGGFKQPASWRPSSRVSGRAEKNHDTETMLRNRDWDGSESLSSPQYSANQCDDSDWFLHEMPRNVCTPSRA
jgi:hypothetical protein